MFIKCLEHDFESKQDKEIQLDDNHIIAKLLDNSIGDTLLQPIKSIISGYVYYDQNDEYIKIKTEIEKLISEPCKITTAIIDQITIKIKKLKEKVKENCVWPNTILLKNLNFFYNKLINKCVSLKKSRLIDKLDLGNQKLDFLTGPLDGESYFGKDFKFNKFKEYYYFIRNLRTNYSDTFNKFLEHRFLDYQDINYAKVILNLDDINILIAHYDFKKSDFESLTNNLYLLNLKNNRELLKVIEMKGYSFNFVTFEEFLKFHHLDIKYYEKVLNDPCCVIL